MTSPFHQRLVEAWSGLDVRKPPYILPGDDVLQEQYRGRSLIHSYSSYKSFLNDPDHGRQPANLFHTGLLPVPYTGNLSKAKVFILMGNPGFGYHDYYGEYEVPRFRAAVIHNLRQQNDRDPYPIPYLNPCFGWHGGSDYWRGKFSNILRRSEVSYVETLQLLAQKVAILETIPYHSISMGFPGSVIKKLKSVQLMRDYVHNDLIHRARKGEIALLSLRGNWGFDREEKNVVVYSASERRAAHLTLASRGGQKLVKFLSLPLTSK